MKSIKEQLLVSIIIIAFVWLFVSLGKRAERDQAIKCLETCKEERMPLVYWDDNSCVCGDRNGQNVWIKRSPTDG